MSTNPNAENQSLRKALKDAHNHILVLEKRLAGDTSDDDAPSYIGATSQELVFANEGLTNANIGLHGRLEHAHDVNQELETKVKMLEEELKRCRAANVTLAPILEQNFGPDSKSNHEYNTMNIHNLTVNVVQPPTTSTMSTTAPEMISDGMDIDIKKPLYKDACRREQQGGDCQISSCHYWHARQEGQWGHIRQGLFRNATEAKRHGQ